MIIDKVLENDLFDNGIYEAWQFVINTEKTLAIIKYCKETIFKLISVMHQECKDWKENLWNDLISQENKIKKVTVTTDSLPDYVTSIVGQDISMSFLMDKLSKDFFSIREMRLIVYHKLLMWLCLV